MDFDALLNLIISIVSGFFGGYFSIYLKERSYAKRNHLDTLKLKVLEPINEAIGRIPDQHIEIIHEDTPILEVNLVTDRLVDWSKSFSLKESAKLLPLALKDGVPYSPNLFDPMLYDDLKNHFKDLTKIYSELDETIRKDYLKFSHTFKQIYGEVQNKIQIRLSAEGWNLRKEYSDILKYTVNAAFLKIECKDEPYWPNAYEFLKKESDYASEIVKAFGKPIDTPLEIVVQICDDLNSLNATREYKDIKHVILSLLSKAKNETMKWINYEGKLLGKCGYF